jgi:hypothetical protein
MTVGPQWLLIGAVAAVGVLHTMVPDHWVPITLIARERGWSRAETARAAFQAGIGHVLSTLMIALAVWLAGVAVATRFGHIVDTAASLALIAFGSWIAISAWRELSGGARHGHSHGHGHSHSHAHDVPGLGGGSVHGPELQQVPTGHGDLPHARSDHTGFAEHDHGHDHEHSDDPNLERAPADDPLYAPLRGDVLTRHIHVHRHGRGVAHTHWHDHAPETAHAITASMDLEPPLHEHRHKTTARTALLLILGSSPMVEGIPAFFAAGRFGVGLIVAMSAVFAISTIATYVLLCVASTAGLQRVRLGAFERYGEVLSGAFIALVGLTFWIWPAL